MGTDKGKCPGCDGHGEIGQPCGEHVCQKRGYHFIATRYWERSHQNKGFGPDPHIGQLIGDFLIVDTIGAGGFGTVYLGLQQPLFRLRGAVKLLNRASGFNEEFAEAILEKFEGEASALAELSHPNIVRLLKYGMHAGHPYLAMEYVDRGRTLLDEAYARAESGEPLPYDSLLHIMRQLLNGLDAAHSLQIIHRDIKPENIMIQRIAGDPLHVRILDFGMAKYIEKRNDSRWALGSPTYMAPEQLGRSNIGPWTDLFAVGVICFELFTGKRPYPGDSDHEIVVQKLDPDNDPLARIDAEAYPEAFLDFLRKALATEPEDRFQDTQAFWRALEAAVEQFADEGRAAQSPGVELTTLLESRDLVEFTLQTERPDPDGKAPPPPAVAVAHRKDEPLMHYEPDPTLAERVEIGWESFVEWFQSLELERRTRRAARAGGRGIYNAFDRVAASEAGERIEALATRVGRAPLTQDLGEGIEEILETDGARKLGELRRRVVGYRATRAADSGLTRLSFGLERHPWFALAGLVALFALAVVALPDSPSSESFDAAEAAGTGAPASEAFYGEASAVRAVSAARTHTCALLDNDAVRCWGANRDEQLGQGSGEPVGDDEPALHAPLVRLAAQVDAVDASGNLDGSGSCALLDDGTLRCWGSIPFDGRTSPETSEQDSAFTPISIDIEGGAVAMTMAGSREEGHGCALSGAGNVYCWGANRYGQLGYGHTEPIRTQQALDAAGAVELDEKAVEVTAGQYHTCARVESGRVYCWGWNRAGQLGHGHTLNLGDNEVPAVVGPALLERDALQLAAGRRHTCAVVEGGDVFCWGWNERGQLGYAHNRNIGDDETPHAAGRVDLGGKATQIAAGDDHSCALLDTGAVRCWGANDDGQLGYPGTLRGRPTPAKLGDVELGAKAVAVAAGSRHTCAVTDEADVICWGSNTDGQLGYGHTDEIGDDEPPSQVGPAPVIASD